MAVLLDGLTLEKHRFGRIVFQCHSIDRNRIEHKSAWVVLHRIFLACVVIIKEQTPCVVFLVGIRERNARTELHGVVTSDGKIVPLGRVCLRLTGHPDQWEVWARSGIVVLKVTLSTRGRSGEVNLLHHTTSDEQLRTNGKTIGKGKVEIQTCIGCKLRQVVTLNGEVSIVNQGFACSITKEDIVIKHLFCGCKVFIIEEVVGQVGPCQFFNTIPSFDRGTVDTQTTTHTDVFVEEVSTLDGNGGRSIELEV